jgi:PAS domain S-box-containing protein
MSDGLPDGAAARWREAALERAGVMGSFEWHVSSGRVRWSDGLRDLLGGASADEPARLSDLLALLPEGAASRLEAALTAAVESGHPLELEEPVALGTIRTLRITGDRLAGDDGDARILAVVRDVTGQRRAEAAARAGAQRLATILDASPDAVVVVGMDGRIVQVNPQAADLLGYETDALVGVPVEELLPEHARASHVSHRERYERAPTPRPMGAGLDLYARHRDGRSIPVDIALTPIQTDRGPAVAAFIRDATLRRNAEEQRRRLHASELARQQALELNDNVVQELTAAIWLLETGAATEGLEAVRETLAAARAMMTDLLGVGGPAVRPGELVRSAASPSSGVAPPAPTTPVRPDAIRVVIADDAVDIRTLLSARLSQLPDVEVVAEAEDGREAVRLVEQARPHVLLLDLSMPRMDGLEAATVLRAKHPDLRIVILSGHSAASMENLALEAGADLYVEKGGDFQAIVAAVRGVAA